jgi:hypothetical protein
MQARLRDEGQQLRGHQRVRGGDAQLPPNGDMRQHRGPLRVQVQRQHEVIVQPREIASDIEPRLQAQLHVREQRNRRPAADYAAQPALYHVHVLEGRHLVRGARLRLQQVEALRGPRPLLPAVRSQRVVPASGTEARHLQERRAVDLSVSNLRMLSEYCRIF